MTIEALIALALYTLAAWFVTDHFLNHNKRETWEQYPDLGEVDRRELERAVRREAWESRPANIDLVTRQDRMAQHPQRIARR